MSTLTHKSIFESVRFVGVFFLFYCDRTGWFSIAAHYNSISVIIKSSSWNTQSVPIVLERTQKKRYGTNQFNFVYKIASEREQLNHGGNVKILPWNLSELQWIWTLKTEKK